MQQEKKYESDARATPPSFGEMVEMIKKLFTDYLEDVIKAKPSEITKSWERYKTLNHLFQEEQPNRAAIGVSEDDDQLKFLLERGDLWKTRALAAELALEERKGAEWVKASERLPEKHIDVIVRNLKTRHVKLTKNYGHDTGWDVAMDRFFRWDNTEWLDESGKSKNEFVNILDNALDAGKDVLAELKKQNESKEGNKEREVAFAEHCKMLPFHFIRGIGWQEPATQTEFTTEQLWNEWNNQQNRNK
jgi:hypothetical protein